MNIWSTENFIFKSTVSGINIYNTTGLFLGIISYLNTTSVWADNNYLYISTTNSGVIRSPMSSISGSVYDDLNIYKNYPDINNEYVNYVHGDGNYLCVATISGAHIFDLTTESGVYSNTLIAANKCYQLSDRTSYYIYDNKLTTVYIDNSTYLYESGDGIIPTVSGINDIYVVDNINNLILLATTDGAVVIEESKGNEVNSLFKYFYIEE